MTTVGAFEAKTHFSKLLEQAERGDRVIITKHGTPVAVLCRMDGVTRHAPKEAIARLKAFRQKHGLAISRDELKNMIEEGRL
jgi:antitoxin (DNA-binding transcriptional repressor) of toxin-antitoxin stability system